MTIFSNFPQKYLEFSEINAIFAPAKTKEPACSYIGPAEMAQLVEQRIRNA